MTFPRDLSENNNSVSLFEDETEQSETEKNLQQAIEYYLILKEQNAQLQTENNRLRSTRNELNEKIFYLDKDGSSTKL
jgi:hypothetical protein